jgi:glycogen debranching enzyme
MAGDLALVDGTTYFLSSESGDIEAKGAEGFFHADMRHLSTWCLLVADEPLHVLASSCVDYYSARVVGTLTNAADGTAPAVSVARDRFVADGVHEDLSIQNNSERSCKLKVELRFGSDFADILECKSEPKKRGTISADVDADARSVTLIYARGGYRRATRIAFSSDCDVRNDRAVFRLALEPRERWQTCIDVTPVVDEVSRAPRQRCGSFGRDKPKVPLDVDEWLDAAPALQTSHDALAHVYRRSLVDLASLRFRPLDGLGFSLPAGGLPWFMALFGRDSLVTSYETLPFQPLLARTTLEALARLQAREDDAFRDAEPGKILHELRFGELATLGDMPHGPYYGSHGSTPLFLIVLDEYERWTGDRDLVASLEPAARAALDWLENYGDLDGDGYLEYRKRSPRGLDNQGWKESGNAVCFADGRPAEPPIATCDLQGLAYDARRRTARLARDVWRDEALARRLEGDADRLRERFNRDFWIAGRQHFAFALDGGKRHVDSLTSNVGQLLQTGIVADERASAVVERLLAEDMFTGFGVRTMSAGDAAYNPIEYHNGTVWPHDTALIAEGMRLYGFREEASRLVLALIDAAVAFDHRLPEVFAGIARDGAALPVRYPAASCPQAWAAGSVLLGLRTLLGLDVVEGRLRTDPHVPRELGALALRGVYVRGRRLDVASG